MFAIAIKLSLTNGFGGYIFMDAKNTELVKHYAKMLGAVLAPTRLHEYRMEVFEEQAQAYDYHAMSKYCRQKGIKPMELPEEERKRFEFNPPLVYPRTAINR